MQCVILKLMFSSNRFSKGLKILDFLNLVVVLGNPLTLLSMHVRLHVFQLSVHFVNVLIELFVSLQQSCILNIKSLYLCQWLELFVWKPWLITLQFSYLVLVFRNFSFQIKNSFIFLFKFLLNMFKIWYLRSLKSEFFNFMRLREHLFL